MLLVSALICGTISADPPAGYYDPASGLTGVQLQAALHNIIDNHTSISYSAIWDAFPYTDKKPNGKVWDMYSDIPGGTPPYEYDFGDHGGSASGEGDGFNREHSWPSSWFGGSVSPMYTDLFHIVPTDIYVNNRRGSYAYGDVSYPSWVSENGSRLGSCVTPGYSGVAFEPRDEYKGDFARNYFYMSTRYYSEDGGWPASSMTDGAELRAWAVDMLMDWHAQDPVSDKELDRNEAVYGIQHNRNPFIDHPEYVFLIYDPTGMEEGDLPAVILLTGFPNPFSSSTTVAFETAEPAEATLHILDVSGRTVRTLMEGETVSAGSHQVTWDGTGTSGAPLSAGVYFCRLQTPTSSSILRMLLIR